MDKKKLEKSTSKKAPKKVTSATKKKVLDIALKLDSVDKKPEALSKFKKFVLPKDNDDLVKFIQSDKTKLTERVVDAIAFGIDNKLDLVEVFEFYDTNFVITLDKKLYLENLENIYAWYISSEKYELCSRIKPIKDKIIEWLNPNPPQSI